MQPRWGACRVSCASDQGVIAVINADETEVRMLKPGNGNAITGYLSGYAGDADHRYVFTTSGPT